MKILFILLILVAGLRTFAQQSYQPTDRFSVEGLVDHSLTFSLADLDTMRTSSIHDIVVTNHTGASRGKLTGLVGIPIKFILSGVPLSAENPKVLSEFYFVFVATDNYKVVFSWNEIFNTEVGNNLYIITQQNGKNLRSQEDRISIICTTDFTTGRRYLKNLKTIQVARAR